MGNGQVKKPFDEMGGNGAVRAPYALIDPWLSSMPEDKLAEKRQEAEMLFRRTGITFPVYTEDAADTERLIPFDLIPRILSADEWTALSKGLEQRVRALNLFLHDVYHDQAFLKSGKIEPELILHNEGYLPEMQGFEVPGGVYTHVSGIDIVRTGEKDFYVLEDNCRTPSGVSYMLEDREVMMRLFPDLFTQHRVAEVSHYPELLHNALSALAPRNCMGEPTVAVLTPGMYNSAYYEHYFLADEMGVELVEGADLFVDGNIVFMRTTRGPQRVDILYRRIDDAFIDPLVFRPDSVLGVPGLMNAYRAGNVTLANAPGAGIADDKAVYTYVPDMVRFFLGEEPILNNVPTYRCSHRDEREYVLDHLHELVVKDVHGSGGKGMLIGPHANELDLAAFREKINAAPHKYIAQPTLQLSTCPTLSSNGIVPCHVDLRPFVLTGQDIQIVPGGLTRVALREGSLVVNSSQGGGTKDTWVLEA